MLLTCAAIDELRLDFRAQTRVPTVMAKRIRRHRIDIWPILRLSMHVKCQSCRMRCWSDLAMITHDSRTTPARHKVCLIQNTVGSTGVAPLSFISLCKLFEFTTSGERQNDRLDGFGTRSRSWKPSKQTEGITAEVTVDTYFVIKAIYIFEFSFGFEQASVVRPLHGDLSVEQIIDKRKFNQPC